MSNTTIHVENRSKHYSTVRRRWSHAATWLAAWILFANFLYVAFSWPLFLDLWRSFNRLWLTW